MTSRLPGVWPAYLGEQLYFFSDEALSKREYTHTCNYGMFPCNIVLSQAPSSGSSWSGYTISACKNDSKFVLSWETLSQWYHFFTEYYHLLNDYGHCNRTYYSAEDYYNYEHGALYQGQMKYGTEKETYLELDRLFYERGGNPIIYCQNREGSDLRLLSIESATALARNGNLSQQYDIVWAEDNGFYKWICTYAVPTFSIPKEYRDYWNKKKLFYPDVVTWLGWFHKRKSLYTDLDECPNADDCCDCQEFFNRGGNDMYERLTTWYEDVNSRIISDFPTDKEISGETKEPYECFYPTIYSHVYLQGSLENLGMEDNLAEEYQIGVDYRTAESLEAETNTKGGAVVSMSGDSAILLENKTGFGFDNCLMEKYYDEEAFGDYTKKYVTEHPDEFVVSAVTFYTFTEDNAKLVTSASSIDDAIADFNKQFEDINSYQAATSENGWILIGGILYPIEKTEYGIMGNRSLFVYREDYTDAPFTMVNGRKVYAKLDLSADEPKYYFTFFSVEDGDETITVNGREYKAFPIRFTNDDERDDLLLFINYNGVVYKVDENSGTTVDGVPYNNIIRGYADTPNGQYYIIKGNEEHAFYLSDFNVLLEDDGTSVRENTIVFAHEGDWGIYSAEELTGATVSKIYDLRAVNLLIDDIGNTLQGIYSPTNSGATASLNHQPPQGGEIEPMYQVGNVANVRAFSQTVLNVDEVQDETNYFYGDIITGMRFYYVNYDDEIQPETVVTVILEHTDDGTVVKTTDGNGYITVTAGGLTSLRAIQLSTEEKEKLDTILFYDDIYCDVTYHCGATLARKNGEVLYYLPDGYNHGVQYNETVNFRKVNQEYYLRKPSTNVIPSEQNNVSAHSISYPICCYELVQEMTTITSSTYETSYEAALAEFKTNICIYKDVDGDTFATNVDMAKNNNLEVSPTYKEEYKIGVACPPKVDSTVDVDRGINAAFERHIKLGEVTSLEALELYGNGYFTMMTS